ncbi:polysaccharide biosynthesis/export family protein [Parabacteroides sp. BX2]|jgi:polysaccharide biosynthesis/export protein|uniref:Polysaccharide biosynthesis/export family protein n=1 Tax=Parabacteroides segnis TaxID=2763058 RepID=A0ABR7E760_9BACT|nr:MULTISPECIES: polysaccharide biosynthesis/export family protein [Parabacteroides]MBC5644959.1 polysaccharide biosynthesis/export family protein [Parabacteroides segnis]MCM0712667.1 polysaccharide biosynthesis/export family protein [Parabacteroides sp. TA-V-105]
MKITGYLLSSLLLVCLLSACGSVKDVAYLQGGGLFDKMAVVDTFEMKIVKNDILDIAVSCADPELLQPFTLLSWNTGGNNYNGGSGSNTRGYLVEIDGTINFPLLGKIKVTGLTRRELTQLIQDKLIKGDYIKDPIVTVRFQNFRILVLGEVVRPGSYNISSERVTLFEALSLAGDLTIYGSRNRVAVIRETDGERTILYHDLRSRDIFNSPDFFLQQNDMIYVEPNRIKAEASAQNQFTNIGTWISMISFLMTASVLIFK